MAGAARIGGSHRLSLGRSTDPLLAVTGPRSDLKQAEDKAERLGGGLVAREAAECRAALAAISG